MGLSDFVSFRLMDKSGKPTHSPEKWDFGILSFCYGLRSWTDRGHKPRFVRYKVVEVVHDLHVKRGVTTGTSLSLSRQCCR